jgi:hypothetical protein
MTCCGVASFDGEQVRMNREQLIGLIRSDAKGTACGSLEPVDSSTPRSAPLSRWTLLRHSSQRTNRETLRGNGWVLFVLAAGPPESREGKPGVFTPAQVSCAGSWTQLCRLILVGSRNAFRL